MFSGATKSPLAGGAANDLSVEEGGARGRLADFVGGVSLFTGWGGIGGVAGRVPGATQHAEGCCVLGCPFTQHAARCWVHSAVVGGVDHAAAILAEEEMIRKLQRLVPWPRRTAAIQPNSQRIAGIGDSGHATRRPWYPTF